MGARNARSTLPRSHQSRLPPSPVTSGASVRSGGPRHCWLPASCLRRSLPRDRYQHSRWTAYQSVGRHPRLGTTGQVLVRLVRHRKRGTASSLLLLVPDVSGTSRLVVNRCRCRCALARRLLPPACSRTCSTNHADESKRVGTLGQTRRTPIGHDSPAFVIATNPPSAALTSRADQDANRSPEYGVSATRRWSSGTATMMRACIRTRVARREAYGASA